MNEYAIHIELEHNYHDLQLESLEDYYIELVEEDIQELQFED